MPEYDEDLFQEIKERFKESEDYWEENYQQGERDLEFTFGLEQWDTRTRAVRERQFRPCLTYNQMLPYANQVVNDYRQARPSIRVTPVDDEGDIDTAEIIQGLIRATERQSRANIAYDTAMLNSVCAGLGWIRVCTQYVSDDSFDQEPIIKRVINFRSVYLDPKSMELDGSDADYAFVFDLISKEEYEDKYPDFPVESFEPEAREDWVYDDGVRIAEHFYKVKETENLYKIEIVKDGITLDRNISEEEKKALDDSEFSYEIIDQRKVDVFYIKRCLVSGGGILEEDDWIGDFIPIVPTYGMEAFLNGKREFQSLTRQAKDAQRAYNYWKTASTEFIALQQKAPFIAPIGSFASYPNEWENANNENYAYLEYDITYDDNGAPLPPPQRQPPITGSPAMFQEAQSARDDIRLSLGIPHANMGEQGNEISGIAIRNRQIEGDNATFHFSANMAVSMSRVGMILLDLYKKLYDEKRIIRIIGSDGKEEQVVPINQPYVKEGKEYRRAKNGENPTGVFDFNVGKYDVVMDIGASYSSKRQETADKLTEVIAAKPELMDITGDLLFKALDLPMAEEIAERIKATMPPEVLGDDPQAARMQAMQQNLEQMGETLQNYEAALKDKEKNEAFERDIELKKVGIDQQEANTKAEKTAAEIEQMRAETAGFSMQNMAALSNTITEIKNKFLDVDEVLELFLDDKERQAAGEPQSPDEVSIAPKAIVNATSGASQMQGENLK